MHEKLTAGLAVLALTLLGAVGFLWEETPKEIADTQLIYQPHQNKIPPALPASTTEQSVAYRDILTDFRAAKAGENSDDAVIQSLTALQQRWPKSFVAVEARLFQFNNLGRYLSPPQQTKNALNLLGALIQTPELYFTEEHLRSSLSAGKQAIVTLADDSDKNEARDYCLRLRWLAPRVKPLETTCQPLIAPSFLSRHNASFKMRQQLVANGKGLELKRVELSSDLQSALSAHLLQPYQRKPLIKLVLQAKRDGELKLAKTLYLLLLDLDAVSAPFVERALHKN